MLENDSSDPNSVAVRECIKRSGATPQPCELNESYKMDYCKVLIEKGKYKGTADMCTKDPKVKVSSAASDV
jgi:hypothetical protein